MPISVDWYDEDQNIILIRYAGEWQIEDVADSNIRLHELAQKATGRFDIISDSSDAGFTPPVGLLWEWEQNTIIRAKRFPNWKLAVFVVTGDVLKAYFEVGLQSSEVIRKHCRFAKTIGDAVMQIVADRRSEITTRS